MNIQLEKLRKVMHTVKSQKGEFIFFGLFLRDEAPDRWDLVVSAPWLEREDFKALKEFTKLLTEILGKKQIIFLSRVVPLNADEPALQAVLRIVDVDDGVVEIKDSDFFGMKMKQAYIFRAKRPQPAPLDAA